MEKTKDVFRSDLIIFIGDAGNAVYQHLCQRSAPAIPAPIEYIQKTHLYWIEFVRPGEGNTIYLHQSASTGSAMMSSNLNNAFVHMRDTLKYKVSRISTPDRLPEQNDDGPGSKPLVYIVGHVCDTEMRVAIDLVRANEASWNISCLCCCYPLEQAQNESGGQALPVRQSIVPDDLAEWGKKKQLDFCYLFGDNASDDSDAVPDRATIDYAAAQALFALLTIGIKIQGTYKDTSQFKLGTLSTCLINVPREVIVCACRSQVAAFMVADWLTKSEEVRQNDNTNKELCELVDSDVHAMEELEQRPDANIQKKLFWWWSMPRENKPPPAEQYTWPGFSLLKNEQSTKDLFQHTIPDNWPLSQTWLERAEQSYSHAQKITRPKWRQLASDAWNAIGQETINRLDKTFQLLMNDKNKGVAWIIAYVDTLNKKLEILQQQISMQEKDGHFSEKDLESDEYLQLRSNLTRAVELQPAKPALHVLAGLACTSMLVFLLLWMNICFPVLGEWGLPQWLIWPIVVLVPLISILAINWFFLKSFYLPGVQAKRALLRYYRYTHASYCNCEEQEQRAFILRTLKLYVESIRSNRINSLQKRFEEDAKQAFITLFGTDAASRCIFVGNNGYFSQNDEFATYTFLKQMPDSEGKQKPTAEEMFSTLADNTAFSSQSASYLFSKACEETSATQEQIDATREQTEDFYARINTLMESMFSADTIINHLNVNRDQINDIWNEVFSRLNGKLWRKQGEIKEAQYLFLCGSESMLGTTRLRIASRYQGPISELCVSSDMSPEQVTPDWFLVAALYYDKIADVSQLTE